MRKELSPGQRADLVKYRFECAHHMIVEQYLPKAEAFIKAIEAEAMSNLE